MGGAFALTLIMVFFWMPESAYSRQSLNIDTGEANVFVILYFFNSDANLFLGRG